MVKRPRPPVTHTLEQDGERFTWHVDDDGFINVRAEQGGSRSTQVGGSGGSKDSLEMLASLLAREIVSERKR